MRALAALAVVPACLIAAPLAAQGARAAAPVASQSAAPRGGDSEARALLDRAAAQVQRSGGFRAPFTQRIGNPILGSTVASAGTYSQRGPGVFSVDFTQPAGDRIVSDGTALWIYVPSATPGQVLRLPVGSAAPGGVDLVGQFFTRPSERFTITDGGAATLDGGEPARRVQLVPKQPMGFTRATVWLDPKGAQLRQLEV
ncbi:MAG: outer membrane lipoprotein carrier protein LolA, partial [Gemmatimonadaceae bacterium]|nr:outer membrane lipoprotein carrier protein LolA [Gemmatimonadaceae bacterium]